MSGREETRARGAKDSTIVLAAASQAAVPPPLVFHLVAQVAAEGLAAAVREVLPRAESGDRAPLVFHAHLGSSGRAPATLYPSSDGNFSSGPLRDAFAATDILPEPLVASLRQALVRLNPGARGLVYNARMADLIRFLALVKTYAAWVADARELGNVLLSQKTRDVAAEDVPHPRPLSRWAGEGKRCGHWSLVRLHFVRFCWSFLSIAPVRARPTRPAIRNPPGDDFKRGVNELLGRIAQRGPASVATAVVAYGHGTPPEISSTLAARPIGTDLAQPVRIGGRGDDHRRSDRASAQRDRRPIGRNPQAAGVPRSSAHGTGLAGSRIRRSGDPCSAGGVTSIPASPRSRSSSTAPEARSIRVNCARRSSRSMGWGRAACRLCSILWWSPNPHTAPWRIRPMPRESSTRGFGPCGNRRAGWRGAINSRGTGPAFRPSRGGSWLNGDFDVLLDVLGVIG